MQDFLRWLQETGLERVVWATDMDLTLLDKSSDPNRAATAPGLEAACERLDSLTGGKFFVVTGRDLAFVDREVFPDFKARISAEYHCMVRFETDREPVDMVERPQWNLVDDELKELTAQNPSWRLRIKPFMRSLHHHLPANGSTVKQQLHDSLKTLVARLNAQTGQTVEVIDGGPIFDLKPQGPDKATAMADIMKFALGRYSGTLPLVPLYFGDSPGDLPAAHFVRENGGKFIAVGDDPRVTAIADFRLANPAECRALVATIAGMMPRRANTIVPPGLTP